MRLLLSSLSLLLSIAALIKAKYVERRLNQLSEDTENLLENAQILDKYQEL